ncbi:MAG: hypothetical protein Q4E57_09290 [Eubacteriales bacterium]|nr:hypothetical protein [Eubacteriales bacterium]
MNKHLHRSIIILCLVLGLAGGLTGCKKHVEEETTAETVEEKMTLSGEQVREIAGLVADMVGIDVNEFMDELKAAFRKKSLEDLSRLCNYPVFVYGDTKVQIVNIDDPDMFVDLMTDAIFDKGLEMAVEEFDASTVELSESGIVIVDKKGKSRIVLNIDAKGKLGITEFNIDSDEFKEALANAVREQQP